MRFHWQNLNDGKIPRWGGGYRHGRAWLTLFEREGRGDGYLRTNARCRPVMPSRSWSAG